MASATKDANIDIGCIPSTCDYDWAMVYASEGRETFYACTLYKDWGEGGGGWLSCNYGSRVDWRNPL